MRVQSYDIEKHFRIIFTELTERQQYFVFELDEKFQ